MKIIAIALVLIVACSAGCKSAAWDDADVPADASPFAKAAFRPLGDFNVHGSEYYKGHDPVAVSARLDLLDSVMDKVDEIRAVLRSGGSWQEKQRRVTEIMTAPDVSKAEAWFVDQIGSSIILERLTQFGQDRASLAEKSAAIHFLRVLVAQRSPNAPLIADALEATWDLWTPERARAIALASAEHAEAYLQPCTSCTDEKPKSSAAISDEETRLIAEGRVRLLQLAKSAARATP